MLTYLMPSSYSSDLQQSKKYLAVFLLLCASQLFAQPTIISFSPALGPVGTTVTISGNNFDPSPANNIVYFGSVRANISSASSTSLTVTAPAGASYQPVTVTTAGLTAYSNKPFTITFSGPGGISTTSFGRNDITSANGTYWVALGDLDGDGKPDMATANGSANTISLFRNTSSISTISFAAKTDLPAGNLPFAIAIADIDGDGKQDVVTTNYNDSSISIFKNTSTPGNISLAPKINFPSGSYAASIAIGDLDNDGKPDIVVPHGSTLSVAVLKNTSSGGTISFATQTDLPIASNSPSGIAIAYLDADNSADLAVGSQFNTTVSIFRNNAIAGTISFATKTNITAGSSPAGIAAGDIDGDGKPDLAVANQNGSSVSVFRNTTIGSSITFATKNDRSLTTLPFNVAITDMDGDGKTDILTSNSNSVSVIKSTSTSGSLLFNTAVNYPATSCRNIAAADMDGDGKPEMAAPAEYDALNYVFRNQVNEPVITSFSPTAASPGATVMITGGNFSGASAVTFGGIPATSFTVVSSTRIDAVVPSGPTANTYISVTTSYGTISLGGFSLSRPTITSFTPVTGPSGTSVVITGTNFNTTAINNAVYFGGIKANVFNAGNTSLTVTAPVSAMYKPLTVTNNGLTAGSVLPFTTQFVGGAGALFDSTSFGPAAKITTGGNVTFADFDGDGKNDLAVLTKTTNTLSVLRNLSTPANISFGTKTDYGTGNNPTDICTGDFDGDGKQDIAVVNYTAMTISIYKNISVQGTISFAPKVDFATGNSFTSEPLAIAAGDIDGDGKTDIVASQYATSFVVMRNTTAAGIISFTAAPEISYSNYYGMNTKVVIAELDGDGKPDLAIMNYTYNNVLVFRNTSTPGSVSFAAKIEFSIGVAAGNGAAIRNLASGDLDGDGKLDLAAVYAEVSYAAVLRNTSTPGNISFAPYQALPLDYGCSHISISDLDGDGKPDLASINYNIVSIFKNMSTIGTISFAPKVNYAPPVTSNLYNTCVPADVDGDDKPDLLISSPDLNSGQNVFCLRNHVNGPLITSFTPLVADAGSTVTIKGYRFTNVTTVKFGDIDATSFSIVSDSVITAVISNGSTGNVSVLSPGGLAILPGFNFSSPIPVVNSFSPASGVVSTSVIITGNKFTNSGNTVFFGATKGIVIAESSNSVTATVPPGASYQPITVTTANNLTAAAPQPFNVTFPMAGTGLGASTFTDKINYPVTNIPWGIAASDLDGDSKPDLMVTVYNGTSRVCVFRNNSTNGAISFAPKVDYLTYTTSPGSSANVTTSDLDGDGKPEMVVATSGKDSISVFRNTSITGAISFAPRKDYRTAQFVNDVSINDMDLDGKPDIITTNASGFISVARNQSTPGNISLAARNDFATPVNSAPQRHFSSDLDGDKKPDVVCTNANTNNFSIFRNTSVPGTVSFAARTDMTLGVAVNNVVAADLDGDGKNEMVLTSNSNFVSVFRNTSTIGNISFDVKTDLPISSSAGGVAVADIDGDGKPDIVVGNTNFVSVIKNNSTPGTLSFAPAIAYSHGLNALSLAIADFNGDSKPDISCVDMYGTYLITVFKNRLGETDVMLCPPTASTTLSSGLTGGTYQWQVSTDSVNYTNVTNGVNFSGATTANLQLVNIPMAWSGYRFRCISGGVTSNVFTIIFGSVWTGASNTLWNNPSNWSCGVVPNANTDVYINIGTVVVNVNAICRTIRLAPGVSFTINTGVTLTVVH